MAYRIKEIFYTLQGEGGQTGRPAVFCRFSGCNLWSGREEDRESAICKLCDTDFAGTTGTKGGVYGEASNLAQTVAGLFPVTGSLRPRPFVICTGGEPLLQLDGFLVDAFHANGLEVAVETNGTLPLPAGIDWICASPKAGTELVVQSGNELKLLFPQTGVDPAWFEYLDFDLFFLQPVHGKDIEKNTRLAIDYCLAHPQWRLSLQTHKLLGIP